MYKIELKELIQVIQLFVPEQELLETGKGCTEDLECYLINAYYCDVMEKHADQIEFVKSGDTESEEYNKYIVTLEK